MENITQKQCSTCKEWKPLDKFPKDGRKKYGCGSQCNSCKSKVVVKNRDPEKHREYNRQWARRNPNNNHYAYRLKDKYGLTITEYDEMIARQDGVCAICGSDNNGKRLHVDHDHKTGKIRKLLCHGCNVAIGHAKEDVGILEKIIGYLKSFS
jgi:hypothetical protein